MTLELVLRQSFGLGSKVLSQHLPIQDKNKVCYQIATKTINRSITFKLLKARERTQVQIVMVFAPALLVSKKQKSFLALPFLVACRKIKKEKKSPNWLQYSAYSNQF